jgi:predicted glycosyltransferase involved in capsule biosynthesis
MNMAVRQQLLSGNPVCSGQETGRPAAKAAVASLVIPLRLTPAIFEGRKRLAAILDAVPRDLFEIVVVDYGTPRPQRLGLLNLLRGRGVRLVRARAAAEIFSIADARNIGALAATAPVVIFHDVDFLATPATYRAIAATIAARDLAHNARDFFMVPVAFLNRAGTRRYLAFHGRRGEVIDRWVATAGLETDAAVDFVSHASSCLVVNRHHYLAVGGHDVSFKGHGAEDYELYHRLAVFDPHAIRPPDYYDNVRDIHCGRGFRAAFASHAMAMLEAGLYLVHLNHPKRAMPDYYHNGSRNFEILRGKMEAFDRHGRHPAPLEDAKRGATLLLCCDPEAARETLRHAIPLMGRLEFATPDRVADAAALIRLVRQTQARQCILFAPEGVKFWRRAVSGARRAGISCLAVYPGLARGSWVFDPVGFGLRSGLLSPKRWRRKLSQPERDLAGYLRSRLFPRSALRQLHGLLQGLPRTREALLGLVHYLRFSAYSFVRSESGTLGTGGALLFTEIRGLTAQPVVLETVAQVPEPSEFRRHRMLPHKHAAIRPCHETLHQKLIWRAAYLWVYFRSTPRNRRLLKEDPARLRFRLPGVMKRILGFEGQGLH